MKEGGEGGEGSKPSFLPHPPPRSFTSAIFRAVFDSCSSFFAPKLHRDACYAGYLNRAFYLFSFFSRFPSHHSPLALSTPTRKSPAARFNPLSPKSDRRQISPCNITAL